MRNHINEFVWDNDGNVLRLIQVTMSFRKMFVKSEVTEFGVHLNLVQQNLL